LSLTYLSPGDPAEIMLTECGNIPTPELLEQTRAELGLDKPFAEQYCRWAGHVVQGELGKSYSLRVPVIDKIKTAFNFLTFAKKGFIWGYNRRFHFIFQTAYHLC